MAEYQRGTGRDQLPQGGASQANAATPPPAQGPETSPADIPVQYMNTPPEVNTKAPGDTETLDLLTGPSDPTFIPPAQGPNRVPKRVVRNLGPMLAAARDPESPPSIKALYNATIWKLEKEMQEEG